MKLPVHLPRVPADLVAFVEFFAVAVLLALGFFLLLGAVVPADLYHEFRGIIGTLAFLLGTGATAWGFEYPHRHRHH